MSENVSPTVVSFLSDFGTTDESVGVCRAIMVSLAPQVHIVDITHDIAPYDVKGAALALVRAVQYLPSGVVIAAVDPQSDKRAIAVEIDGGVLIGPDNGVLAPAVAMLGGPKRVVVLNNDDFHLTSPGAPSLARDVLAPVVGHLASGVALELLGEVVDPITLTPGLLPLPTEKDGAIVGEVWWVDRYGNVQTNIDPDEMRGLGADIDTTIEVQLSGATRMARWVTHPRDARPSELVLVVDAHGLCSLVVERGSAASMLNIKAGAAITLVPPRIDGDPA
jgi:S-adenosylmethionine hydrolase